ncbi:MAG: tRNA (N6-threonylcarbamoyladenosine(37)-N6)-methyltransferase TrmO, partial [Proteobacteria bacterium]
IGTLLSPFREKFGIPRQSLMMNEARGTIKLNPDPQYALALKNLEQFTHIWVLFDFHKNGRGPWHPLIDTPRIEAGERMGVFATRSPHRPNAIGMSAVRLERLDLGAEGGIEIHINGVDIMDGTPVLDIKPYLPFADRIEDANSGWAHTDIRRYEVVFLSEVLATLKKFEDRHPRLLALIEEMLAFDPRPTSQRRAAPIYESSSEGLKFAFRILDLDIHWMVRDKSLMVFDVKDLAASKS